jgi:predicted membrane-bound mannosyltransferase
VLLFSAASLFYYSDARVKCAAVAAGGGLAVGLLSTFFRTSWVLTDLLRIQPVGAGVATGLGLAGGLAVVSLWRRSRECLAFWMFSGIVQFVLYSLAGEKAPWLAVHVLLPWIVVSAACSMDLWRRCPQPGRIAMSALILLLLGQTVRSSWLVNTINRSNAVEPLIQTEFDHNVVATARTIVRAAALTDGAVATVDPEHNWPFGWYLRDVYVDYVKEVTGTETAPVIVASVTSNDEARFGSRYLSRVFPYLTWSTWLSVAGSGDLKGMLTFMLFHDRWGDKQHSLYRVSVRRDLAGRLGWPPDIGTSKP